MKSDKTRVSHRVSTQSDVLCIAPFSIAIHLDTYSKDTPSPTAAIYIGADEAAVGPACEGSGQSICKSRAVWQPPFVAGPIGPFTTF